MASYGVLALVPPLLAIVLAMTTRQVLVSLFAGVWAGALVVAQWNPIAATALTMDWLVAVVRTPFNTKFIVLILFMGAGAAFIYRSGGILALERWIGSRISTARESQILTWLIGVFIFFDSYTSTVVTGNATRELAQDADSSREMHAYVLDSTTAPVTTFGPVSNWIGYQVSMIIAGLEAARVSAAELGTTPFGLFLQSIPWNIYCFMAFFMVGFITITQRFFGPMLDAEWRARTTGDTIADGATPLSDVSNDVGDPSRANPSLLNFFGPIAVLLAVGLGSMWYLGGGYKPGVDIATALQETDVAMGLLHGAFAFMVSGFVGALAYGTMDLEGATDTIVDGFKTMNIALAIIVLAWGIGMAAEKVGTADFIVTTLVGSGVPAGFLPLLVFLAAMFVAFTTGTSWGTMAILTPVAIPLGYNLAGAAVLPVLVGVLFGGAIWGDHSSPISDTTVMSSIFAGSDHIDHVTTQIPFAATAAGVTIVMLVLYAVGLRSPVVALPLATVLTLGAVVVLNKLDTRRKGLPEVMPRADAVDEADREAAANGTLSLPAAATSYDYLSLVPVAAVGIVLLYLSLVFVFAALGG
ncbi:Na+/H+ antiporter NhaC family protein [Halobacterium salinarum]|uniref:Putative NhaC-type sodium/proton antiporter n=1 Tax=Halobacterium salinarum (strain ATCC 33171 / DSM 3754 / JCM 8978 / NBRC 102687 / NCIMB 764 / 91-R6) TaxID=2597657 RepID=A0A4D6GVD9_HALS9|nr:Na+/H+ antiporter NhaC family protein [Halobacterium salinarum]MDL0144737.1 Na+/H+ antiporter NhaC family protein [Halobacterium salinarum]QCC45753.1 putative NhaC-type sodium/proton antiporter [Halobacterium salinarum]TYO82012.1 transporter, NhaC family [Halobacterium salinarum DSM 3754]